MIAEVICSKNEFADSDNNGHCDGELDAKAEGVMERADDFSPVPGNRRR